MPLPPLKNQNRVAKAGAWLAICVPMVMAAEGMVLVASRDPVGIPTGCFGETEGVRLGERYTRAQCTDALTDRLITYHDYVHQCLPTAFMGPYAEAAITSFTYNVGKQALCSSTLAKKLNANDPTACEELKRWVYAGPLRIKLRGLVKRRAKEYAFCVRDLGSP